MQVSRQELLPDVKNLDDLMAKYHIFISGPTGAGKDVVAQDMWNGTSHACVLFDVEEEPFHGVRVKRATQVAQLLVQGQDRIVLEAPPKSDDQVIVMSELRDVVFEIGEDVKGKDRSADHFVNVFCPEVWRYSPKHDKDGPVPDLCLRGRKRGVHVVASAQSGSDVSHTLLKQTKVKILFGFDDVDWEYWRQYGVPVDELKAHTSRKFSSVLVKGQKWMPMRPAPFSGD